MARASVRVRVCEARATCGHEHAIGVSRRALGRVGAGRCPGVCVPLPYIMRPRLH